MTEPEALDDEKLGEMIYLALYEHQGARWAANESKDVWYAAASRLRSVLSSLPVGVSAEVLADALGCFWNAAIGDAQQKQDSTALAVASSMAEGFAAIECRLREHAALQSSPPVQTAAVDGEEIIKRVEKYDTPAEFDARRRYTPAQLDLAIRLASQHAIEGEAVAWQIGNDGALYPTKEAADKHIAGWALKGQVCGPARPLYARPAPPVSPTRTMADVLGDQKIGVTLQNRPVIG